MSDPIVQRATQQIAEQSMQQGTSQASSPGQANSSDQVRFEQAMHPNQAQGVQDAQQVQMQAMQSTVEAQPPGETTLGDAILDGLEKMKSSHDSRMEGIQDRLTKTEGAEMTVQDALALQFEVMQLGIEQDLTTKVADKTSQGVQTLFRNQ